MTTPAIQYTARDFETIKEALKVHLQTKFPNDWKDFYESSIGMALLELFAYVGDILSYQTDFTANNMFLETARSRKAVLNLGKLAGYQLRPPTSASVLCRMSIANLYPQAIVIPAGTTIKSVSGIDFIAVEEARINAGTLSGWITFTQGVNYTETFISDGTAFQKFVLANSPMVMASEEVSVDSVEWDRMDSLVYGDNTTTGYVIEFDENGIATLCFGDGTSCAIPALNSVISITYRVGGGVIGNVALNQISSAVIGRKEGVVPIETVSVDVINDTERGSGGEDAETLTHAKLWIPRWIRTNGRAVTEEDYDSLANAFVDPIYGSPAFAKARLKQNIPELNTVELLVWARDYEGAVTTPSQGLKDALEAYFNNDGPGAVKMVCTRTEVLDGSIVYIDIDASVNVDSEYVTSDVLLAVRAAITALFSSEDVIPGYNFRISSLYQAMQSVAGVEHSIVNSIVASYKKEDVIGLGDDVTTSFTSTIVLDPGSTIRPYSVRVTANETLTDNGEGLIVDGLGATKGSIDYDTGAISVTFTDPPPSGSYVYAEYRYVLDYQRGDLIGTGNGTTRLFKGAIKYPPVNPLDTGTGQKGIAFSDGTQVVTDDGNGNLVGDVDPYSGVNRIDYDTGAYNFTFVSAPANGAEIRSTYMQLLNVDSQDIPIDKHQIAVEGLVSVDTLTE